MEFRESLRYSLSLSLSLSLSFSPSLRLFSHLHEIVEGLYFHRCLSVCVCVCLSECVSGSFLVNKMPAERMHQFGCGFR